MHKIIFQGKSYPCKESESVLEALLRANINVSFSCRNGICHTCLLQAVSGTPSQQSQKGLKKSLTNKGLFLACKCQVDNDLEVELPKLSDLFGRAVICDKEMLTPTICRLYLEPSTSLYYHPGQFINIRRSDGLTRSYSLSSVPSEDPFLELHVKRMPGGAMSQWLIDEAQIGSEVDFQGPLGDCYYRNTDSMQNLLLVCTGTGLSPLLGIVRDALNHGHKGQIVLYHGSSYHKDLYYTDYLSNLEKVHTNFRYIPCASKDADASVALGRANDIAFSEHKDLSNWRVYIAGHPAMAYTATKQAAQQGACPESIYVDPFEHAHSLPEDSNAKNQERSAEQPNTDIVVTEDPPYPNPDPEMWLALEEGKLLTKILTDFYNLVFDDEKLNGFFKDTTKSRAIEKQYNFLRKVFTGEKVYFGEKPRNAHHWMIISNELFDYREAIMKRCLEKHNLPAHLICRWIDMENAYKQVIVKSKPWPKIVDGVEYPVDGFGEVEIESGTICDGCAGEIAAGETVSYHLRLGTVYCGGCKNGTTS